VGAYGQQNAYHNRLSVPKEDIAQKSKYPIDPYNDSQHINSPELDSVQAVAQSQRHPLPPPGAQAGGSTATKQQVASYNAENCYR